MKRLFVAAMAALAVISCTSQSKSSGPTIIEGKVNGYSGQFAEFFFMTSEGIVEVPVSIASDGTFRDTLQTVYNGYDIPLFMDRFMFRLAMEPGKEYHAEFDLTTGAEDKFRFIGEGEKENRFMADYWGGFRYADNVVKPHMDCESFEEFLGFINEMGDPMYAQLKEIGNRGFVKYYSKELDSYWLSYVLYYPFARISASGTYRPEKAYLDTVKKAPKLTDEEWTAMLKLFCANAPYIFPNVELRELMRAVVDFTPKASRQSETMEGLLNSYASAGTGRNLAGALEFYKENAQTLNEDVVRKIENTLSVVPGAPAPEIEFEDINGNIHSLAEFQGKPLYVDFWASWCGPCCAEIPHLQKFVDSLGSDPEIACISISIDTNRSNWTDKLAEDGSTWPQFLATSEGMNTIAKTYGITAIPRFILINADGTLASLNAARPSDANILQELKSSLK